MRSLSILTSFGVLTLASGCTAPTADTTASSESALSATTPSFVKLSAAPACAKTSCAQYSVQDVNKSTPSQLVGNLDFSKTTLTKSVIADVTSAPPSEIVLRGTLGPVQTKTGYPSFIVTEAYRGLDGLSYDPSALFYQGGDYATPPPCGVGVPCPEGKVTELNTSTNAVYDAVSVDPSASLAPGYLEAQIRTDSAVVAGHMASQVFGTSTTQVLTAAQVFRKLPYAGEGVARLSVQQADIVDPAGSKAPLKGWNWGEWGSVQPTDGSDAAGQGAKVVRIILRWWGGYGTVDLNDGRTPQPIDSFDPNAASTGYIDSDHLALLSTWIDQATSAGLWVDLAIDSDCGQASLDNDTVAACNQVDGADPNSTTPLNFANFPPMAEKFTQAWEYLARTYQGHANIGMLEILPEPQFTCKKLKSCDDYTSAPTFYRPIIQRIRAIDPVTPILVGPTGAYDLSQIDTAYIDPAGDSTFANLIYTGDILSNASQSPTENVGYATAFQTKRTAPVFIQQVGVRIADNVVNADGSDTVSGILGALHGADIGWTWWTYREMKSKDGTGYAPFWKNDTTPWTPAKHGKWLPEITSQF
ncbi:MAG TPA: hypothetical protein VGI39_18980 [Polyangiaceae bacterium]|jgi:hypothetical protein